VKKMVKKIVSFICTVIIMITLPVYANGSALAHTLLVDEDSFSIKVNGSEYLFIDYINDTITRGVLNDEKNKLILYYPDGRVSVLTKAEDENIYRDGKLYLEKDARNFPSTCSIPAGYERANTYRTKQSVYGDVASIALSIISLIGGPIGVASGIAGIIVSLKGMVENEVYIEITQYVHKSIYKYYNVTRFYRDSAYTDLIKTVESGPYDVFPY